MASYEKNLHKYDKIGESHGSSQKKENSEREKNFSPKESPEEMDKDSYEDWTSTIFDEEED